MKKIPERQDAQLDGIEGSGYAFTRRTFRGDEIQGVFFAENPEQLEALVEKEEVRFDGVLYKKLRSGDFTTKVQSFLVDVRKFGSVAAGDRVTFKALSEDDG